MSSGTIVFVAGVSSGFLVLGIVPLGWLADHFRRPPIIGIATAVFGVMVFFTGLASNIFTFFLARFGAGVSQASTSSVHTSLLADAYPISLRGRIFSAMGMATGLAGALSPLLVGAIASAFGVMDGAGPSYCCRSRSSSWRCLPFSFQNRRGASTKNSTCWARSWTPTRCRPHSRRPSCASGGSAR